MCYNFFMAEESKKDNPQQMLQARLNEQAAKARMILSRLDSSYTQGLSREAMEFARLTESAGQVQADSSWVTSMMSAGVTHDIILKVWDLKDEQKRDSKNPENPQNK